MAATSCRNVTSLMWPVNFFNVPCHLLLYSQWLRHADASLLYAWMLSSLWWWGGEMGLLILHWSVSAQNSSLKQCYVSSTSLTLVCLPLVMKRISSVAIEGSNHYETKGELGRPRLPLRERGRLVQMKCETKTTSPTTFITPLSWPHCPWSSRGWRGWVTSSISNVIVGLQRGSQFHQGALLAITSWEQNNPALSQPLLSCGPAGRGKEQKSTTSALDDEGFTHRHSVSLHYISCECKNKEGFMRSSVHIFRKSPPLERSIHHCDKQNWPPYCETVRKVWRSPHRHDHSRLLSACYTCSMFSLFLCARDWEKQTDVPTNVHVIPDLFFQTSSIFVIRSVKSWLEQIRTIQFYASSSCLHIWHPAWKYSDWPQRW